MPLSSRHEVTVEWGDCDPAGIVSYPSYFRWCDQASHRLLVAAGVAHNEAQGEVEGGLSPGRRRMLLQARLAAR